MFGIVERKPCGFNREALAALRVFAKERAQMNVAYLEVVLAERFPSAPFGQRDAICFPSVTSQACNQLAFLSVALLSMRQASRSSQDLTNDSAPSR